MGKRTDWDIRRMDSKYTFTSYLKKRAYIYIKMKYHTVEYIGARAFLLAESTAPTNQVLINLGRDAQTCRNIGTN